MKLKKIYSGAKSHKPIFDGIEMDFGKLDYRFEINKECQITITVEKFITGDYSDFFKKLDKADFESIVTLFKLKSEDIGYKVIYETYYELNPYFFIATPENCGDRSFLVCVGMSEVQPARYLIFLQGIFEIIEEIGFVG